jgi:hypothetical protein
MAFSERMQTNFSKGELSPLIEGRPDLVAYGEGASVIENFLLLREGGLSRRIGTRFISEVKTSAKDTILLSFESSVGDSYILEVGDLYIRFYKDKARLNISGTTALEVVSPYAESILRYIHSTQSVDIMFLFTSTVAQRKLSRLSDLSWALNQINFNPPPSFEADTDISQGNTTLTPGATTGNGVVFTCSGVRFLTGDVGRQIIFGAARAVITAIGGGGTTATADILDAFPNTSAIPAGSWLLRLSPQLTLDPDKKGPAGTQVTLVASDHTFRVEDVGKFITIYGGLVKITVWDSTTQVRGIILTEMSGTDDADPDPSPAGAWTLEVASWSSINGYPRTGEFFQGRLGQAATLAEPNVFWLSRSDDYENYAEGIIADDALSYRMATKQLNRIEWLADNRDLFVGTMGSEHRVTSGGSDAPFGGDQVPLPRYISNDGSAPIQPIQTGSRILFVDRSRKKIWSMQFNIEEDNYIPNELTGAASHITGTGIRFGPIATTRSPDPRIYYIRDDGQLVTLTYFYQEKVIGFTRLVTDGTFESVAVRTRDGMSDQVWVIVRRLTLTGYKRFVEMFDDDPSETVGRPWRELYTDSAKLYDLGGVATTIFTGLDHLEGKAVQIIADGAYRRAVVVSGGTATLEDPAYEHVEIGLAYRSTMTTFRPTVANQMVEGRPRAWSEVFARVYASLGGQIQGSWLPYLLPLMDTTGLTTGDVSVNFDSEYDLDGRITVIQDQPYPLTLLALFGTVSFGDT